MAEVSFFSFHKIILKFLEKGKIISTFLSHKASQMSLLWKKDESNYFSSHWIKKKREKDDLSLSA